MEPRIPSRIPSIRPIHINRMTKNATAAHTCAPSPKQSTRDWIRVPGEIGWARPVRHPARFILGSYSNMSVREMIRTQQPHGQEQQQHETMRQNAKQHETTRNNNTP